MSLELERSLTDIGLERNEAVVYTALLRLKSATAGEVAKHTGLHRRSVYDTVDSLLRRGFATYVIRNGAKHYQTAGIERLKDEVKAKENALQNVLSQLASLPMRKLEHSVAVYEGIHGVKSVFRSLFDYLNEGQELIGFGEKGGLSSFMPDYVSKVNQIRLQRGIRIRRLVLGQPGLDAKLRKSHWGVRGHEIRVMPDEFKSDLGIWVCGDRTLILFLKDNPIAVFIESPEIAKGFKEQFEFFWAKGTKVGGFVGGKSPRARTKKTQTSANDVDRY